MGGRPDDEADVVLLAPGMQKANQHRFTPRVTHGSTCWTKGMLGRRIVSSGAVRRCRSAGTAFCRDRVPRWAPDRPERPVSYVRFQNFPVSLDALGAR